MWVRGTGYGTGSVEVAQASTGKFRNGRKLGNKEHDGLGGGGGGHRGIGGCHGGLGEVHHGHGEGPRRWYAFCYSYILTLRNHGSPFSVHCSGTGFIRNYSGPTLRARPRFWSESLSAAEPGKLPENGDVAAIKKDAVAIRWFQVGTAPGTGDTAGMGRSGTGDTGGGGTACTGGGHARTRRVLDNVLNVPGRSRDRVCRLVAI